MTGKLSPRYIESYPITHCVRATARTTKSAQRLSCITITHVHPDPSHIITLDPIQLREDLSYKKQPIHIVDHREKQLRRKTVPLVKVLWANSETSEATWELE